MNACLKTFSLKVNSGASLQPLVWWKMNELADADRVDAVNGVHLVPFSDHPAGISAGAGIIDIGVVMSMGTDFDNEGLFTNNDIPPMPTVADGFSVCFWAKVISADDNMRWDMMILQALGPAFTMTCLWQDAAVLDDLEVVMQTGMGTATLHTPFIPVFGNWYFFHVFYDPSDEKCGVQINVGAVFKSVATLSPPPPPSLLDVQMQILNNDGDPHVNYSCVTDEYSIWPKLLTQTQVAYLYNGGVGRTWPVVLP